MNMKHDTLWDIVGGCKTFEGFCKEMVPVFKHDENFPEEVQRKLRVIQKLIEHSYYEYDFIDVAFLYTFQTLELALSLKYQSLHPTKKALKNLKPYLDWALREKYILPNQKEMISYVRNRLAHPNETLIFGMLGINGIKAIVELISNLFIQNLNSQTIVKYD